jgi:hypothetical protein
MEKEKIEEFKYLWDGTDPGWILVNDPSLRAGPCIFNKIGGRMLHVENAELKELLCMKLKEAGAEILDKLPPGIVVVRSRK